MGLGSGSIVLAARRLQWLGSLPSIQGFLGLLLSPLAGPGSRLGAVRRVFYKSITSAFLR